MNSNKKPKINIICDDITIDDTKYCDDTNDDVTLTRIQSFTIHTQQHILFPNYFSIQSDRTHTPPLTLQKNGSSSLLSNYNNNSNTQLIRNNSSASLTPSINNYSSLTPLTPITPFNPITPNIFNNSNSDFINTTQIIKSKYINNNNDNNNIFKYKSNNIRAMKSKYFKKKFSFTSQSQSQSLASLQYNARKSLLNYRKGYKIIKKMGKTLQGSCYEGICLSNNKSVVVKRVDCRLYNEGMAYIDGEKIPCLEDILKERNIYNIIKQNNPPKYGNVGMLDFYNDEFNYFLILEHGGKPYYKHVIQCHELIKRDLLSVKEYQRHTKSIFYQMATYLHFLHTKCNICHLDISLENFVIKHSKLKRGKFTNDGRVGYIDYGLSECFKNKKSFKTQKFKVGKPGYKSREIYCETEYDARLADIWSLAVCLFVMIIGERPWTRPSYVDNSFSNIMNGYLKQLLIDNQKWGFIDKSGYDLLTKIFVKESKRINIDGILKHNYLKSVNIVLHKKPKSKLNGILKHYI